MGGRVDLGPGNTATGKCTHEFHSSNKDIGMGRMDTSGTMEWDTVRMY